jgi:hypothetical protein
MGDWISDWGNLSKYAKRSRVLLVTPGLLKPFDNESYGEVLRRLGERAHLRIGIESRFRNGSIDFASGLPLFIKRLERWWTKVPIWIDNGLFNALMSGAIHSDEDMVKLMHDYGKALCNVLQILRESNYSDLVVAPADPLIPDPFEYVKRIQKYLNVLIDSCPDLLRNRRVRFLIPIHHYIAPLVSDTAPIPEEFYFTHKTLIRMYREIARGVMRVFPARGIMISTENVVMQKIWWGVGAVGVENIKYIPARNRANAVTDIMRILDTIIHIRNIYPRSHIHLLRLNKGRIPLLGFVDSVDTTFQNSLRSYRVSVSGVFNDGASVNLDHMRTAFSVLSAIMTYAITGTTSIYLMDGNEDVKNNELAWLDED